MKDKIQDKNIFQMQLTIPNTSCKCLNFLTTNIVVTKRKM